MLFRSVLALCALAGTAIAGTVRIPTGTEPREFQRLVDTAAYGDTVLVEPGTYVQVVLRSGIHLLAEGGPEETIIRNDRFWVVKAEHVDSTAVVEGFTLDGIKAAEGVVHAENSQFTVRHCTIRGGWSGVRAVYSDLTVQNCTITDCQNGCYFYESGGSILENDIRKCINGISLVSASTKVQRNVITGNSLGISVSKHSEPSIGGTIASANRIWGNPGGHVLNTAEAKRFGIRTQKPMTLKVPYNFWGSDCPDTVRFRGPVEFRPWVNEEGTASLDECPEATETDTE